MSEIYKHFEPESEARADAAQQKAGRVFRGDYEDFDEALMFLRWIIARHYGMPIFDPYFRDRTLDDLIFETELIRLSTLPPEKAKSETISQNKEEVEALFPIDDWDDMPMSNPIQDDPKFNDMAKAFMETNDFIKED